MNRDKNIDIDSSELAKAGCANGISLQLQEAIKIRVTIKMSFLIIIEY